ncbi:ribokinase [Humibacter sp.]|uniref:ribokinase n=1 Tax=Humibacter sp. TaxID=1940291 RepID=UPI003F7D5501
MTDSKQPARIIVVGSANQDYIVRVAVPPAPGETVLAKDLLLQPGGKGANQAVAAARLRGNVSFVASVGDDADGALLLRELRSEGVDTANVEIINRGRTGLALVSVYDSGENSITVVPGTNFSLTAERVHRAVTALADQAEEAIMVAQAEVLPEIIEASIASATRAGARVILNLAPFREIPAELLRECDPLVLNEAEASALVGWEVRDVETAGKAVAELRARTRSIVVTIGSSGAYWADQSSEGHIAAPAVGEVVDTTGAGDAFVGGLASHLARGASLRDAVELGVMAGTFAVQMPGAQSSYPTPADLGMESHLGNQPVVSAIGSS